jgi:hypothetical protein
MQIHWVERVTNMIRSAQARYRIPDAVQAQDLEHAFASAVIIRKAVLVFLTHGWLTVQRSLAIQNGMTEAYRTESLHRHGYLELPGLLRQDPCDTAPQQQSAAMSALQIIIMILALLRASLTPAEGQPQRQLQARQKGLLPTLPAH